MCEKILHRSISCEDIHAVISLPDRASTDDGCSERFDHFLDTQRKKHENVFERMQKEIDEINMAVDNDLKQYVEVTKEELEMIRNEMALSTELNKIKTIEQWISISDKNTKMKMQMSLAIDELSVDLKSLEKKRTENIEKVLSKYKDEAIKIRFLSIENIEQIFQDKIYEINNFTLNNFQTHEDIKLNLQVLEGEIMKKCRLELKDQANKIAGNEAKRLWTRIQDKRRHTLTVTTMYNMVEEKHRARDKIHSVTEVLVRSLSEFAEVLQPPEKYDMAGEFWDTWIRTINSKVEKLEIHFKSMEGILKTEIATLMETFDEQLNILARKNRSPSVIGLFEGSENVSEDILNEIEALKSSQSEELQLLLSTWQETIKKMNLRVNYARNFVLDLTSIWTNHLARVNKIHKDLQTSLEASHNACLKLDNDTRLKMKKMATRVREAQDIIELEKLSRALDDLSVEAQDNWEDSYETQLEELERVRREDIYRLIQEKIADIQEFLTVKYPKRVCFATTYKGKPDSTHQDVLDSEIEKCNNYTAAVDNRRLGMYEMLERYLPVCEKTIKEESEEWLTLVLLDIVEKYENNRAETKENNGKSLKEMTRVRRAEIDIHSNRLLSHISGVNEVMAELNEQKEELKLLQSSSLDAFYKKLNTLTGNEPIGSSTKQKNSLIKLEQEWNSMTEMLLNRASSAKNYVEKQFGVIKDSNEKYLKTATGFKNGGNYSPNELKVLKNELKKLEKQCETQRKGLLGFYNTILQGIPKEIFQNHFDEMQERLRKTNLEETITETLSTIRMCLRVEVKRSKAMETSISDEITRLTSLKTMNSNLIKNVLKMINSRHDYLALPTGVECLEYSHKDVNSSMFGEKRSTHNLFDCSTEEISTDHHNFFARTKGLLLKKFMSLNECIQEVYGIKSPTAKKTKKPSSSKGKNTKRSMEHDAVAELIERIKFTLRAYNTESELIWLHQVKSFLEQIILLKNINNSYTKYKLSNIHEVYLNNLEMFKQSYLANGQEQCKENLFKREKINKTLVLPLAHPTHRSRLNELHEQAIKLNQSQTEDNFIVLTNYKNNLQEKHDRYVQDIKTLMEILDDLQGTVFGGDSMDGLFQLFHSITQLIGQQDVKTGDVIDQQLLSSEEVPDQAVDQRLLSLEEVPDQAVREIEGEVVNTKEDEFKYPTSIWFDEEDSDDNFQTSKLSLSSSVVASLKTSDDTVTEVVRVSIKKIALGQVKESAEQVQKLYDEAKCDLEREKDANTAWLQSLELQMEQAKLIFK